MTSISITPENLEQLDSFIALSRGNYSDSSTKQELIIDTILAYPNELIFASNIDFERYMDTGDSTILTDDGKYGFIHMLSRFSYHELLKKLLEYPMTDPNVYTKYGCTVLIDYLIYSKPKTNIKIYRQLLSHPKIDPNMKTEDGWAALIIASRYFQIECLKELLKHSKTDINIQTNDNMTALMFASRYSIVEAVRELLSDPNIDPNLQNKNGTTALMLASRHSTRNVLNEPEGVFTVQSKNKIYSKPFKTLTVRELLAHPKLDPNVQNKDGLTALMWASACSNTTSSHETVAELLLHPKIDPNVKCIESFTALMIATMYSTTNSSIETVRELLSHPKIDRKVKEKEGFTAFMLAALEYTKIEQPTLQDKEHFDELMSLFKNTNRETVRIS